MIPQSNSPAIDPNVYSGLAAFTVQDYTEINSKNGTQYETQIVFTSIQPEETVNFTFYTGDDPVIVKFRKLTGEYSDITYDIYKNTVFTGGDVNVYGNLNDVNPVTGSVEIFENVTITDNGQLIPPSRNILGSGLNKTVTYGTPEGERILDAGVTYSVLITNNSNSNAIPKLIVDLGWYQGPIDVEIRGD